MLETETRADMDNNEWYYLYDEAKHLYKAAPVGVINEVNTRIAFLSLLEQPNYDAAARIFHDYSNVSEFKLSATFIQNIAQSMMLK